MYLHIKIGHCLNRLQTKKKISGSNFAISVCNKSSNKMIFFLPNILTKTKLLITIITENQIPDEQISRLDFVVIRTSWFIMDQNNPATFLNQEQNLLHFEH